MEMIDIIVLWLHYLAAVIWIGGMAFNVAVLRPSMAVIEQSQRPALGIKVLKRFIIAAWLSIAVLAVTGISVSSINMASDGIPGKAYGIILPAKHFVTFIMVLIVARVSFVLSPRLAPFAPKPDMNLMLVKTNLSLGVLVLLLTAFLRGA